MIQKDIVFIVSAGRTGTKFLGERLANMIPDAFSVHEPDIADGISWRTWDGVKVFGMWHMVIGRILRVTGARNLTKAYLTGRLSDQRIADAIRASREQYFRSRAEPLVIEANFQWALLLPVLRQVFPRAKFVAIIRNESSWVRSWLKLGRYTDRDPIARSRLSPVDLRDPSIDQEAWTRMTPEEKLRWEWRLVNSRLMLFAASDPLTRQFQFEDLFESDSGAETFDELLKFVTHHGATRYAYRLDRNLISEKVNAA